ncbi:MAG: metal ABC transporter ATP-binding protein [Wenzhouxiangella sp.]|jgi:manganese/iron transport system ATP-binding protein|nr:metal ABC transporter ATP-binding protein [Wenzhouxiangella sp.]
MRDESEQGAVPAVQVEGLSVAYGSALALDKVDLILPAGQLISVVGPNGAGKSTLLRALVGSLEPVAGTVRIFGVDAEHQRRLGQIAYMPQQEQVDWDFPLSVRDVVMSGRFGRMRIEGGVRRFLPMALAPQRHRNAVSQALEAVDMHQDINRSIDTLSGGQRKRVLLARALAQDARLLLLDEPLVGVDQRSEALIMAVLQQARDQGRSVVMVTHDIDGARRDSDFAVLINQTVVDSGDPRKMLTDELLSRTATAAWLGNEPSARAPEPLEWI